MEDKHQIIPILARPLFCLQHEDPEEIKKIFTAYLEKDKFSSNPRSASIKHYDQVNFLNQSSFTAFKQWLLDAAFIFATEGLNLVLEEDQPLVITDHWLNQIDKGGELPFHNHSNSIISGTYYLNHEKQHSPLVFTQLKEVESNAINPYLSQQQQYNTVWTGDNIVNTQTGCLFLWESGLVHGSYPNQEDNRLSISFNIMPRIVKDNAQAHKFEIVPL